MMIVTDSRIESRWNWYSQSKPAVCFNGFRDAPAKQYRSSKHSNYRSKAYQDLVEFPPHRSFRSFASHLKSIGTFQCPYGKLRWSGSVQSIFSPPVRHHL